MQSQPCVYELSGHSGILYAVACDDHKQACFQEASILMQTALQLDIAANAAVQRQDGQLDDTSWPAELIHGLRWIDAQAGSPERLFTIATVKVGPHAGLQAVGIATNQERLKRASNLALAFAAARLRPGAALQLPELPRVTCDSLASAVPKATDKHVNATTTSVVRKPESSDKENDLSAFNKWLNGDAPVDCAKQRLVSFRQCYPCLDPALRGIIHDLMRDRLTNASHSCRPEIWTHVVQDLQTVLKCDTWKEESYGKLWIRSWERWQQPFDDPSHFHFGKAAKKQAHYRWYFGRDPPADNDTSSALQSTPTTSVQNNNDLVPPTPPLPSKLVENASRTNTTTAQNTTRAQSPDSSESIMQFKPIVCNDDDVNDLTGSSVQDDMHSLLERSDLCCRVLDGENIGYSYGREVLRQQRPYYDVEGVRRVVQHYREENIKVIVVTKRDETKQSIHGDGVEVVESDRTDDLIVLKLAKQRNCPVVSRDGYEQWRTDPRVSAELRQWHNEAGARLQVRFSWGTNGEFMPDFDLPQPVARQQSRRSNSGRRKPKSLKAAQ